MANFFVSKAYLYIIFLLIVILSFWAFFVAGYTTVSPTARNYMIANGITGLFIFISFLLVAFRYPPLYINSNYISLAILLGIIILIIQLILTILAYNNLAPTETEGVRNNIIAIILIESILLLGLVISLLVLFGVGIRDYQPF